MDRINSEWMSTLVDLPKIRVHFLGYSLRIDIMIFLEIYHDE